MFRPLLTRSSPLADAPAAAWRAWWKGVLATPPFPKIKVAPGPVVELARVPLNQTWPWIMTDPRGEATLTVYTRAHRAVHGARNVITFTPLAAPRTSRAVYRVPPMTSSEPRGARAAWGDRDVGLLWYEERGTTRLEQLLVLSLGGGRPRGKPARLGLGSTGHMTLARLGRGWAVVYESRADHAFYLQRLTARGKRRGKARRLTPTRGGVGFHLGVQALDAVSTPGGAALVLGGGLGVTLILVDRRGRVKHRQRVDDPRATGSGYEPRLARARGRLCVAWKQSDNWDDRVLARAYRLNGTPVGAARVVARHVDALGSLLAEGAGFRLVWSDQNGAANRVAARRLGAGGEPGPVTALFQGRGVVSYLAAGLHGVTLRLTLVDRAAWPQRLMLKETKLTR